MARRVIPDMIYTFNTVAQTLAVRGYYPLEKLTLITNVTDNLVMYNFSDPTFAGTTAVFNSNNNTTTITLNYNTASMSNTDVIQILVDEVDTAITASEEMTDPVNKLRVSLPQALIDTDFEYGTQSTKWETVGMINYQPFGYPNNAGSMTLTTFTAAANGSRNIIITPNNSLVQGQPVFISDSGWHGSDGTFFVITANSTAVVLNAKYPFPNTASNNLLTSTTNAFKGEQYLGANIAHTMAVTSTKLVNVTTTQAHGLSVGNEVAVINSSATASFSNSHLVVSVANSTMFTIVPTSAPGTITSQQLAYLPSGATFHRAFDGGVRFSTFSQSHGQQLVRQTRRYFRYQSGKGIQISTGTILEPEITIDSLTSSGTTVTVITKELHNLNPGAEITMGGANETAYNGSFTVVNVLTPYSFTYTALSTPTDASASGDYRLSVTSWQGAGARVGLFDDANGVFFEYDGQQLYAVVRQSVFQLSGAATLTNNSATVSSATLINGASTRFARQLVPGDTVIIRGQPYKVNTIASDTSMTIHPPYKGPTLTAPSYATITKVIDTKVPQSQWNLDPCDGTGRSGYNVDLSKMQMFYIDYSWYGAGFIRWGFRGPDGNIIYCHKIVNNNKNYEAYMRSGNLPARYETHTHAKYTELTASLDASNTVSMAVANATYWPNSGIVWVRNQTQSEFIKYSSRSNTSLIGLTRTGQGNLNATITTTAGSPTLVMTDTGGITEGMYVQSNNASGLYIVPPDSYVVSVTTNDSIKISRAALQSVTANVATITSLGMSAAQTFSYSTTTPVQVQLHSPAFAPAISHWGTSVIMDGRYDDDKSFVFTQGMTTALSVALNATNVLQSFRISPSVHNGLPGTTIGAREIVNRMQMVIRQLDMLSAGQFLVTLVLNGSVSAGGATAAQQWLNVGGSSLVQYINHTAASTITGGEVIYGFFTNSSGGTTNLTTTSMDLPLVRDLGNGILGGYSAQNSLYGSTNNTITAITGAAAVYPDGPDVVSIVVRNLSGSSAFTIYSRLSWTEAQA